MVKTENDSYSCEKWEKHLSRSENLKSRVGTIHGDSQVESRDKPVVDLKNGHGQGVVGSLGLGVEANKEAVKVFDSGKASGRQKK